jgi:ADP-heptose:LPS heptosyltransferase
MRSVDTLAPLGVVYDGKGLDYFVPSGVSQPVFFPDGYVALVIGASYFTKKLPLESLKALCSLIPHPIVLVGGKEEVADGETLSAIDPSRIVNTCGAYSLQESALLVSKARLVISHDTGMMYIACAFDKNIIAIWGATSPALQVEPFMPDNSSAHVFQSIVQDLSCQPCSNFGTNTCPKGHFDCMKKQDLPEIARQVASMW